MPVNFIEAFKEGAAAAQRGWEHDRSQSVGASEVFGCIRRAYFSKHHPELAEEEDNWGILERGNLVENGYAVPMLYHTFGEENCHYMGEFQKTFVGGRLSATPDGLVTGQPEDVLAYYGVESVPDSFVVEIKSADARTDLSRPKPQHVGQGRVQAGFFREQTNHKPEHIVVLYIDPANLSNITPFVVDFDEKVWKNAKKRADSVYAEGATVLDFLPEGKTMGTACDYCPFAGACRQAELDGFPKEEYPVEDEELRAALRAKAVEVKALRTEAKDAEKVKKEAEEELKLQLSHAGTNRIKIDGINVSLSEIPGRETVDKPKLEAHLSKDGLSLSDFMTQGKGYHRLNVSGKG